MNENEEERPTQGGGFAIWDEENRRWIFSVTPESFPKFEVGDFVPEEWGIG